MSNLKLYITTHKEFEKKVNDDVYEVLDVRETNKDVFEKTRMDNGFLSEFTNMFWVADNCDLPDYVGFCHYRRYFSFMDDIPNLDELFTKYDAIIPSQIKLNGSVKGHYAYYHNIEDLYIIGGIIADKHKEYVDAWNKVINNEFIFPYNMFIMKREDFLEYVSFVKDILSTYMAIIDYDVEKRINNNKNMYLKNIQDCPQNGEVWYQKRIGGYIGERLTNAFIYYKFKNVLLCNVNITENKY